MPTFTTSRVLAVTGVSPKKLKDWLSKKLVVPAGGASPGKGTDRQYNFGNLMAVATLLEVRRAGLPLAAAAGVARYAASLSQDDTGLLYAFVYADGDFVVVEQADVAAQLRADERHVGSLLSLNAIRESVVAGLTESAYLPRPTRGRKAGQIIKRKPAHSERSVVRRLEHERVLRTARQGASSRGASKPATRPITEPRTATKKPATRTARTARAARVTSAAGKAGRNDEPRLPSRGVYKAGASPTTRATSNSRPDISSVSSHAREQLKRRRVLKRTGRRHVRGRQRRRPRRVNTGRRVSAQGPEPPGASSRPAQEPARNGGLDACAFSVAHNVIRNSARERGRVVASVRSAAVLELAVLRLNTVRGCSRVSSRKPAPRELGHPEQDHVALARLAQGETLTAAAASHSDGT